MSGRRRRTGSAASAKEKRSLRRDRPTSVNHVGQHRAGKFQDGIVQRGLFCLAGNDNEVGPGIAFQFADETAETKGFGSIDRGHLQYFFGRNGFVVRGERAHFFEQIQFQLLATGFSSGGQTIGAEADVYTGGGQFFSLEGRVIEIIVAARTVDDVRFLLRQ